MAKIPSQDNVPINPIHHVEDEVRYEVENCTSRILLQFDSEFDSVQFESEVHILLQELLQELLQDTWRHSGVHSIVVK